jgi:hypothetical protein
MKDRDWLFKTLSLGNLLSGRSCDGHRYMIFSFMCSHPRSPAIKSPHMPHLVLHVHSFDSHTELPYLVPPVSLSEQVLNNSRVVLLPLGCSVDMTCQLRTTQIQQYSTSRSLRIMRVSTVLLPDKQGPQFLSTLHLQLASKCVLP